MLKTVRFVTVSVKRAFFSNNIFFNRQNSRSNNLRLSIKFAEVLIILKILEFISKSE